MKHSSDTNTGIVIACLIIGSWAGLLAYLLFRYSVNFYSPLTYLFVLLQTHLFTGLFITAHDAMHGVVAKNKKLNKLIGQLCATLFVYNSYSRLFPKHHEHHKYVKSGKDPDYYKGNFFIWYFHFMKQYVSIGQIILAAVTYNLLILVSPESNVITFWVVPSLLSTLQLFYFGTYLPHKGEHAPDNIHQSNSQSKNHVLAFLSCYFFGYHYEHHHAPGTPWWKLYKVKELNVSK
ncbi:fatty acid desaturase [Rhodocytophaga rosea]|uniref:Fatty acid desaturase n=1 Tax=Rhodocytophaga rosea TaxID=2704465 RepID=A0A6C0GFD7_9BACT|nr:fatty acid desaturase [Rhodocytophaga rosea]QHT66524.1 fatty acid desaturase [Rhodocytophaga rosea]